MVNKIILIGRLGKEPETKHVGENTVTKFSVATSEKYKGRDGEWKENTDWHNVAVWGKQGENCARYLRVGSLVYVEGRMRYWQSETGKNYADVNAAVVKFLDPKPKSGEDRQRGREEKQDDGLPF